MFDSICFIPLPKNPQSAVGFEQLGRRNEGDCYIGERGTHDVPPGRLAQVWGSNFNVVSLVHNEQLFSAHTKPLHTNQRCVQKN